MIGKLGVGIQLVVLLDDFKVLHVFFRFVLLFVESYSLHSTIRLKFDDFVLEKKKEITSASIIGHYSHVCSVEKNEIKHNSRKTKNTSGSGGLW